MASDRKPPSARHASPPAGDEPLQWLAELHGRLQGQCDALMRLQERLVAGGAGTTLHAAAGSVRRAFERIAGPLHQVEEQELFPALLESMAGSDAVCIREMTEARAAEHRDIEARWLGIRPWLEAVEAGHDSPAQAADLEAFASLYRRHMAQEDQELLAMAERLLSDEALAALADAMRRRQVPGLITAA